MTISGHMLRMAAANRVAPFPTIPGTPFGGGFYYGRIMQDDGEYGLILAPKSSQTTLAWKTSSTNTAGTDSTYNGLANSNAMNNGSHPAAQYCRAYNGDGQTDWYLWSKDEAEIAYRNLKPTTTANNTASGENFYSIPPTGNYASGDPVQTLNSLFKLGGAEALESSNYAHTSTQRSSTNVFINYAGNGDQYPTVDKTNPFFVRPIRRIKI